MSTEKKIHEILKGRDPEKREQMVKKVAAMEKERLAKLEAENPAPAPKKVAPWKIWASAVGGVAVAGAITLSVVLPLALTPKSPEDDFRFCDDTDYTIVQVETTIKEYAIQENKELLYFDWYDETDYCIDRLFQLNDTEEIVCIFEAITDINTGSLVEIHITDKKIQIEALGLYKHDNQIIEIEGVEIGYFNRTDRSFAHFEYNDYIYYLKVEEPIDENHILNLVAELLPDAAIS